MKKSKYLFVSLVIFMLFLPCVVFGDEQLDRQDVWDYKEFFDELFGHGNDQNSNGDSCINVGEVYAECSGVNVRGVGTFDLEDYVAGVLASEFSYTIQNDDLGKAYSIITRSYTMANTNNCKNSISSSTNDQLFDVNDRETYRKYVDQTTGIVMVNSKGIVLAVYSLAPADHCEPTADGRCKFRRCTEYTTSLSDCPGKITEFIVPKGVVTYSHHDIHLGGVEPYIGTYLALNENYDYVKILKAFYGDDISLARLTPTSGGNSGSTNFKASNENTLNCDPENSEYVESDGVTFKFPNYNIEGTSEGLGSAFDLTVGNVSQCPWYAKYRAIEIVESSSLSSDLKEKAKSVLLATSGNGIDWYGGTNPTLSYFKYSNDINEAKAGSIIAWSRNTHDYGHVGIVEKVNSDGSLVISEGWNMGGVNGADIPSNIKVITHTMSLDQVKTYNGGGSFIGYTYLFSHKK